mgnify:CR=1 FL=1
MGVYRLIACLTVPLDHPSPAPDVEKKVREKLKGLGPGAKVYFRYDMADDIETPPDEVK